MNKKVLICGATGFIGQNLVNYFEQLQEYEVHAAALHRTLEHFPAERFHTVDLTDKQQVNQLFKENKFDVVLQAAASTSGSKDIIQKPYIHVTDNAVMNALILQACYDHSVDKFLFTSCGVMYNPERSPVTEADYHIEEDIFPKYFGVGWTKVYVEKLCKFYAGLGRTKHTVMRLSNAYGPYDKYDLEKSHFFGATVAKVMNCSDGDEMVVWGDGSTERDLLHVDDVVRFIHAAVENQNSSYELYNVGCGTSYSVKQVVQEIIKISGKDIKIKFDTTKPSINTKLALLSNKAENDLSWRPLNTLQQGIEKTLSWYKDNVVE